MKAYNKEIIDKRLKSVAAGFTKPTFLYRNMPETRRAGINYVMTDEELIEWAKCYNDPVYFVEKYCKTVINGEKIDHIKLRDYQKEIIDFFEKHRFPIYFHSRQMGITLIMSLIFLHYLIFNTDKLIYVFAPKYEGRFSFLNLIKMVYVNLPFFLKKGLTKWDDNNLSFENGCKIICTNTKKIDNALRREQKCDIFYIMDASCFNNDLLKRSFMSIMPYISMNDDSRLIISTSASQGSPFINELIEYSELPDEAPDKNVFETKRIYWWQLKNRDNEWKNNMIKIIGDKDKFDQEYDLRFL